MKLSDAQKKQLVTIGVTILVLVIVEIAAVFGIHIALPNITPMP